MTTHGSIVGSIEQETVLLVDDSATNLELLRMTLGGLGCRILAATDGAGALAIARKNVPSLILLDVMMPGMDGYEVCRRLKDDPLTHHVPVICLTALADSEDEATGLALGAVDYIAKPINAALVCARVRNHLELSRYRHSLEAQVAARTRELALTQAVMIEGLATLAEYRDPETGGHVQRTQNYVKALALELKNHERFRETLTDDAIELIALSAPLHDVGKIAVPDRILLKPGPLSDGEFEEMKKHTQYGYDSLRITEEKLGENHFLRHAREIAYTHHEKWDGTGYPRGLKGDEIPVSGRIMALADVYDALISKRIYKPPVGHAEALHFLESQRGRHFDPDMVDAFLRIEGVVRNIALRYADFEEERVLLRAGLQPAPAEEPSVRRILVVDDNDINRVVIHNQLVSAGYTVDVAGGGAEALDMIADNRPDVILTDLQMPEMDGYELTRQVRQLEIGGGLDRVTILAITASEFDLTPEEAAAKGFDGYLLKPLDMVLFRARVGR